MMMIAQGSRVHLKVHSGLIAAVTSQASGVPGEAGARTTNEQGTKPHPKLKNPKTLTPKPYIPKPCNPQTLSPKTLSPAMATFGSRK